MPFDFLSPPSPQNDTQEAAIHKADFSCGHLLNRYDIGPYTILEFHPWKASYFRSLDKEIDFGKTLFRGFVAGEALCFEWGSLDEALNGCAAIYHDEIADEATHYLLQLVSSSSST